MDMLLSITAPSGSGKTTIAGMLIEQCASAFMVESYTTRGPRANDLPGEYVYISLREFEQLRQIGWFLWTAEHGGVHYGTNTGSIKNIFKIENSLGIMILVPEVIPHLIRFLKTINKEKHYIPVFIAPPERHVLEERLRKRGDAEEDIATRLNQASEWLLQAVRSGIRYSYIRNDAAPSVALRELQTLVRSWQDR